MEQKLLEVFRSVFTEVDPSEITLDSEFREWDQYSSLTQVELIDAITSQLGVKIKLRPFIKAETIGDVLDIINEE
jgi:acyl carrier protein